MIDSTIIAATIEGVLNVLATAIPSVVAIKYAKQFLGTKRANKTALSALKEIRFLRAVEQAYQDKTQVNSRTIRQSVTKEQGLHSTKLFTTAQLERKLAYYEHMSEQSSPLE
ncbi:hypothetical protein [Vibrio anguillarum]|uniref:Uncharacterized protein n=2 Tax=Vibrio anguillarum TaxID=55601 RepID=A0A7U6FS10_VIBAN|nr:hypothetical protein [Vibrio anguillarum]AZS26243.1 hypothetical protein DYL72_15150 [Vibrio anguillarum]MBF4374524.1 hypothetical protein [Vibrio anguillarum]